MPRRPEPRYRIKKEFRDHLRRKRHGWPLHKWTVPWMREYFGAAWANGAYSAVRQGKPVSKDVVHKLITYIRIGDHPADSLPQFRQAWNEYLHRETGKSITLLSNDEILALICEPARNWPVLSAVRDARMNALDLLANFIKLTMTPRRFVELCDSEEKVRKAIRWMYIEAGRHNSRADLPAEDAIRFAEDEVIRCPRREYESLAIAWSQFDPWTIVFACDRGTHIGMSLTLPMKDEAYLRARAGELPTYRCSPNDMHSPSPNLILEGCAMRPGEMATTAQDPTRCLLIALVCQQARLTRVPGLATRIPMRMLGVGGTPKNCERLLAVGFKLTGTQMAHTGVDLYERTLLFDPRSPKDCAIAIQWWGLQRLLGRKT